ncbi:hypothetical protein ISF_01661 [Cordyceps fumosorosea ARSEF 2679]|uniref:Uncharacterized protein n=1 Tax=Cordyceps fumosorosea (strain ARSEF 2679) TaxID=1081104 RepID=A0A168DGJ3_CORFA|nr:hypothetical protein ISF_01661 [Cordyceps fumosorosea ARSEF 2679]OAA72588.1 hypothetical protein ISF_01661 [Cordyceps fumosorosea ARSEF 2679]
MLNAHVSCDLASCKRPERGGREKTVAKSSGGKYTLVFQFINTDYLIMRNFALGGNSPSGSAPRRFKFMGVRKALVTKYRCEEALRVGHRRGRSPSPGGTWFERSHPEGWWNSYW